MSHQTLRSLWLRLKVNRVLSGISGEKGRLGGGGGGACERKEKERSQEAERDQLREVGIPWPPRAAVMDEAVSSVYAGASALSSSQKEHNQQIPQDFLLLCPPQPHTNFSIRPVSRGAGGGGQVRREPRTAPTSPPCIKVFTL